jgi:RNase P/RNase MRP subunit POP5
MVDAERPLVRRPLTVRDRVGRKRYVAFRLEAHTMPHEGPRWPSRRSVSEAVAAAAREQVGTEPRLAGARIELTIFDGQRGLFRVPHHVLAETRALLSALELPSETGSFRIVTLGTSGTLLGARERWLKGIVLEPRLRTIRSPMPKGRPAPPPSDRRASPHSSIRLDEHAAALPRPALRRGRGRASGNFR